MKISISKPSPSLEQLAQVLRQRFSGRYNCELFTLGDAVFVSKSRFAAVQISTNGSEINLICSSRPSLLVFLTYVIGGGMELFFMPTRKRMLREVGFFLKEKYS